MGVKVRFENWNGFPDSITEYKSLLEETFSQIDSYGNAVIYPCEKGIGGIYYGRTEEKKSANEPYAIIGLNPVGSLRGNLHTLFHEKGHDLYHDKIREDVWYKDTEALLNDKGKLTYENIALDSQENVA